MVMISFDIARTVLSGSYTKDLEGLQDAYHELISTGCQVLSPHRLDFDDADFVRDKAEISMSVKEIESHHLVAIRQSDFVWLHAPNGYVGLSAALEIGYAISLNIPVFSKSTIEDSLLRTFVVTVSSVYQAKQMLILA